MKKAVEILSLAEVSHRLRRLEVNQVELANALNVSQSQISRVLSGETSMSSRVAIDICNYVISRTQKTGRERVRASDELLDAVSAVWDGTPGHARALSAVIRSLTLLSPAAPSIKRRS